MMRNTEVHQVMALVESALLESGDSPAGATPIFLTLEGGSDSDIARLRHRATVEVDVPSGSDRPVVGSAIVFAKRVVRRGMRWYLKPAFEQQTSFNHSVLDLLERVRLDNDRLRREVDRLRPIRPDTAPAASDDSADTDGA